MSSRFQDTVTGMFYSFPTDDSIDTLLARFPELPKTLSSTLVLKPTDSTAYNWSNGEWVPDVVAMSEIDKSNLVANAKLALVKSDAVGLRCWKASVPFPPEWLAYDVALRAIVNGTNIFATVLPAQPAYPAGT